mmetsp:Transcript_4515/g.7640  ORF Transcript_4515/g.7640 Transcript_4515/m.7640 type:complete len:271 (+) Transcript_4515:3-815(+)
MKGLCAVGRAPQPLIGLNPRPRGLAVHGASHNSVVRNHSPSLDPDILRPLGIGFSAGGLLFPYYIGVASGLQGAGVLTPDTPLAGASAGCLIAACVSAGLSEEVLMEATLRLADDCRRTGTYKNLGPHLGATLRRVLPVDAHLTATGRVYVAVTRLEPQWQGQLLDSYDSREDLIMALLTSCHIPLYFDGRFSTNFRGAQHFDGGLSRGNFLPVPPNCEQSLRVCCLPTREAQGAFGQVCCSPDTFEPYPHSFNQMVRWALTPAPEPFFD